MTPFQIRTAITGHLSQVADRLGQADQPPFIVRHQDGDHDDQFLINNIGEVQWIVDAGPGYVETRPKRVIMLAWKDLGAALDEAAERGHPFEEC